jgi:hypothetical protein
MTQPEAVADPVRTVVERAEYIRGFFSYFSDVLPQPSGVQDAHVPAADDNYRPAIRDGAHLLIRLVVEQADEVVTPPSRPRVRNGL